MQTVTTSERESLPLLTFLLGNANGGALCLWRQCVGAIHHSVPKGRVYGLPLPRLFRDAQGFLLLKAASILSFP